MAKLTPSWLLLAAPVLPALLGHHSIVNAQITGCDAIGNCPFDCPIGNTSTRELGTLSLRSSLVPAPLTWTIGIQHISNQANISQPFFDRNFFLGTSPDVDFTDRSGGLGFGGCAVFLDGISEGLYQLRDVGDDGTCHRALGGAVCVDDLAFHATSLLAPLVAQAKDAADAATLCAAFEQALHANPPPSSCVFAGNGSLGTTFSRALTGPSLPAPLTPDPTCDPRPNKTYALTLLGSFRHTTQYASIAYMGPILYGTTPVLSVFWNATKGGTPGMDAQVSCLATQRNHLGMAVGGKAGRTELQDVDLWGLLGVLGVAFFSLGW